MLQNLEIHILFPHNLREMEKNLVKMLDLSMIFRNRFVIFVSIGSAVSFVLIVKKSFYGSLFCRFSLNQKALDIEIP